MKASHCDLLTRRRFAGRSLCSAAALITGLRAEGGGPYAALRDELAAIFASCGFDASAGGGSLLAVMSDPHIFLSTDYPALITERWDDDLIAELNALCPPITHLVLAGDLITHHSMTPGSPRYPRHEQWSLEEYDLAMRELQRFRMPMWIVPGNHDTDAYETDAEMFQEKIGVPAYQRIELSGLPVLLLNTGNAGMLDRQQEEWLRAQAHTIPPDREVLIVQHVPTFFLVYTQAGSKRIIAEAFGGRLAPVYIASGHNHSFVEGITECNGTRFFQMTTTTANRVVFNDGKNPGYLLLAIQDGHVIARIRRSLAAPGFWLRPAIDTLPVNPVRFPFDGVEHLLGVFEEGFYDVQDFLQFHGVHVGCYIAYCKWACLRVTPSFFYGAIRKLYVSALIEPSAQPSCWLSRHGADGPWEELLFPPAAGSGLYLVDLPEDVAILPEFHIKVDTGLTGNVQGFSWSGWALASDDSSLTGYEKWLLERYGTLVRNQDNAPNAIARGGSHPNLLTYAYNLPPCGQGQASGLPEIMTSCAPDHRGDCAVVRYTRARDRSVAGLDYHLERSIDMSHWVQADDLVVEEAAIAQDGSFERVEAVLSASGDHRYLFYRVRVNHVSRGFGG